MSILQWSLIGILVMAVASGCSGLHSRDSHSRSGQWKDHVVNRLKLNEYQKQRLETLVLTLDRFEHQKSELKKKHRLKLARLVENESIDRAELESMTEEIQSGFNGISKTLIGELTQFHETLDSDQKQKLSEMMKRDRSRRIWN